MRKHLFPLWGCALTCALANPAPAAEPIEGTPACHRRHASYCAAPVTTCRPVVVYHPHPAYRVGRCYDPCEPVGPVRRFFRRVFLPPCPRPCPAPCPAPLVAGLPAPPPVASVPFNPPPPAPVEMGRPVPAPPPPAPAVVPPVSGSSYPRLTPPLPEPPVRADRIASTGALEATFRTASQQARGRVEVTLVAASRPQRREQLFTDDEGKLEVEIPDGEYLIYARTADGRWVSHGRIQVREHHTAKVTLLEQ
jgi:hypothetical protein